ncbi:TOBE domain-containing protein [Pasteurellaceae bacterium 20609_3]|uniref:TOBE domain-containing protein n=1 Tax=Spirabiliibacterium mucosae TaxID=28156 RepID=UPI001AACADAE|nr:TOBE domain-containing protein [Spirabiliibacterium mucosae]MBE2898517.1 TOBE domain-containing protein [Spirabiliibacterium mucosae]
MTISARNQLSAKVKTIKSGAVNDQIELSLNDSETLVAVITSESTQNLSLSEGRDVVAVFKAPSVILSTDDSLVFSARNQLRGVVESVNHGAVNCEVLVKTQGGAQIVAIITETSAKNMNLAQGSNVQVLVKASHVLLAVKK